MGLSVGDRVRFVGPDLNQTLPLPVGFGTVGTIEYITRLKNSEPGRYPIGVKFGDTVFPVTESEIRKCEE